MDPFAERMLKRARARRDKLEAEANNVGVTITHKITPLLDTDQMYNVNKEASPKKALFSPKKSTFSCASPVKPVRASPVKPVREPSFRSPRKVVTPPPISSEDEDLDDNVHTRSEEKANEEEDVSDKENGDNATDLGMRDGMRSRLKRLGALYSGCGELSSPIHRTENEFSVESEEPKRSARPSARVARLAALANSINQWEDDLSHPSLGPRIASTFERPPIAAAGPQSVSRYLQVSPFLSSAEFAYRSRNPDPPNSSSAEHFSVSERHEKRVRPRMNLNFGRDKPIQPNWKETRRYISKTNEKAKPETKPQEQRPVFDKSGPSRLSVLRPNSKAEVTKGPKQLIWDRNLLTSLESQGFSRSESRSRLVYAFPKEDDSIDLSPEKLISILEERGSPLRNTTPVKSVTPTKRLSPAPGSPQKSATRVGFASPVKENSQPFRVTLKNVSGVDTSPAGGSVLQRAAQYEAAASPTHKPAKDPADLPLHERMALFEKNKGPLLVPRVPFSTPMPAKLMDKARLSPQKTPCPPIKESIVSSVKASPQKAALQPAATSRPNKVLAKLQMFESGQLQSEEMSPSRPQAQAILERQREVEMLANRWNRLKEASASAAATPPPPPPPPMPSQDIRQDIRQEPRSPARVPSVAPKSPQVGTPPPPPPMPDSPLARTPAKDSPRKSLTFKEPKEYPSVKRVRISPTKPGQLYPSLSDMETTTESEICTSADSSMDDTESSSDANPANGSFGRDLLEAAEKVSSAHKPAKKGRFESESDISLTESNVLDDIDDYLDEAMAGQESPDASDSEGPSPTKRSRDYSAHASSQAKSASPAQGRDRRNSPRSPYSGRSPHHTRPSPKRFMSPLKSSSPEDISSQDEGHSNRPLMHTVSFYRRQQNVRGTPVRQIVRNPTPEKVFLATSDGTTSSDGETSSEAVDESALVKERIRELRSELERQRTLIDQNSKYLNICLNTVEFPNFDGRVESERLLLVATHTHRAIQSETTRLEIEKSLCPKGQGGKSASHLIERGKLHIEEISVPLKRDFILSLAADDYCHHFVSLVRCNEQVLATTLASVEPGKGVQQNSTMGSFIRFTKELLLTNLYNNFTVTLEVYTMRTKKTHDSKHHSKKESSKHRMTPKKTKQDSVFVRPPIQSPAGPLAVRTSQFKMIGYVVFSLREIQRTHFTLNKVAQDGSVMCPLQGSIHLKLKSDLSINIEEKGFLTMFEDVSGFGAWHRRWCVLKGEHLSYWKYPDDVSKKVAIGTIDLRTCTTDIVGPVNRDICARLNTFLLETTRSARPDDKDSLVTVRKGSKTTIRHLLSADNKEERVQWCRSLNKALTVMRAWGKKPEM